MTTAAQRNRQKAIDIFDEERYRKFAVQTQDFTQDKAFIFKLNKGEELAFDSMADYIDKKQLYAKKYLELYEKQQAMNLAGVRERRKKKYQMITSFNALKPAIALIAIIAFAFYGISTHMFFGKPQTSYLDFTVHSTPTPSQFKPLGTPSPSSSNQPTLAAAGVLGGVSKDSTTTPVKGNGVRVVVNGSPVVQNNYGNNATATAIAIVTKNSNLMPSFSLQTPKATTLPPTKQVFPTQSPIDAHINGGTYIATPRVCKQVNGKYMCTDIGGSVQYESTPRSCQYQGTVYMCSRGG